MGRLQASSTIVLILLCPMNLRAEIQKPSCGPEVEVPGRVQFKQALPDPCTNILEPTAGDIEAALTPFFSAHTLETKRSLSFWHYGYRTPRYPTGAPAGVYDSSTPVLSDHALAHPTGTPADFAGPVDPNRSSKEYFLKQVAGHLKADHQESS